MTSTDELERKFEELRADVERFKTFVNERVTQVRLDAKGSSALTVQAIENLQEQMNDRFEGVHTRLDLMDKKFETQDKKIDAIDKKLAQVADNIDFVVSIMRAGLENSDADESNDPRSE